MEGDAAILPVNMPDLPHDLHVGDTVLLNDGAMKLKVLDKNDTEVKCRVVVGGVLVAGRGLVVPSMRISSPLSPMFSSNTYHLPSSKIPITWHFLLLPVLVK